MNLYHYPKSTHKRVLTPRLFRRYQTYKKYLQYEFARVCVYCREPDTTHRSSSYAVDHYRPKGNPKFAALICDYSNLFYCCQACNSRKNDWWPLDENLGPYIVNPCDFKMSEHLRFDKSTCEINELSELGKFTSDLLQLNDPSVVAMRKTFSSMVDSYTQLISKLNIEIGQAKKLLKDGKLNSIEYDQDMAALKKELDDATNAHNMLTGNIPVTVRKKLHGLNLV